MNKKRIIIHTQYYPPEIGAPQNRLHELAKELLRLGHEVIVLTAMPNYPTGKIYPGYGGLLRKEQLDGVSIIRTGIYPTQTARFIPRLLNYFSFVFSSIFLGGWFVPSCDYILTESPPLFLGIAGYLLSRWKHARWIFNVSDLWPESAFRLGIVNDGLALHISRYLEAFCYHKAWRVSGQSQGILQDIESRFPTIKTIHFSNGVDTSLFSPDLFHQERFNFPTETEQKIIFLYTGLHGLAQGLDQILDAAKRLEFMENISFVFIGDGPEKSSLIEKSSSLGLKNVFFLDPIPHKQIPNTLASADVCIIPLKKSIPGAVPSKLYEAMAGSKPVLMIADGEPADIVNQYGVGLVVKPGYIEGISHAIEQLANHPKLRQELGISGRKAAVDHFDIKKIIHQFEINLTPYPQE